MCNLTNVEKIRNSRVEEQRKNRSTPIASNSAAAKRESEFCCLAHEASAMHLRDEKLNLGWFGGTKPGSAGVSPNSSRSRVMIPLPQPTSHFSIPRVRYMDTEGDRNTKATCLLPSAGFGLNEW